MTQHVVSMWAEIGQVIGAAAVLLVFAVLLSWPHRPKVPPGSSGHRKEDDEGEHETIRADGYIDSFHGDIEEAGGSFPPVVAAFYPGIIIWWAIYLILFLKPH